MWVDELSSWTFEEELVGCGNCDTCLPVDEELAAMDTGAPRYKSSGRKRAKASNLDYNTDLFAKLRDLRKDLATKHGLPPFMIFSDVALQEMSYYFPEKVENFLQITWVWEQKLANFWDVFLAEINSFMSENNIVSSSNPVVVSGYTSKKKTANHHRTHKLLEEKLTITEISKKQGYTTGTIFGHIKKLINEWENLDISYLKPKDIVFDEIKLAIESCEWEKLRPVFDHLDGKYDWDEIRIVKIFL